MLFCWDTTRLVVQRLNCNRGLQVTAQRLIADYTTALHNHFLGRTRFDCRCSQTHSELFSWPQRRGMMHSAFGASTRDFSLFIPTYSAQMSGARLKPLFAETRLTGVRTSSRLHSQLYSGHRLSGEIDKLGVLGPVLFTFEDGLSGPWCPAANVPIRASSTTAAQKRETAVEDAAVGQKSTSERPSNGAPEQAPRDPEDGKVTKAQQLKKVFKEYGAVGVAFHVGISLVSLGICYAAVSSGIDMTALLFKLGFSETLLQSRMAAGTSTFVLAYAVHKLFAPLRISITLVSVPLLVRYFRKTGLFKPPASAP